MTSLAGGHRRFRRADVEALLRVQSRTSQPAGATGLPPAFSARDGDLDQLAEPLSVLARVAAEGIGATSCVFTLPIGEGRLRSAAGYSRAGSPSPADGAFSLEEAPAPAEVLRNGRRLVIADLATTSLLAHGAAKAYLEQGDAALLALPLVVGVRHAGVMQLSDSRGPRAFTGAKVAFAEFMARQAGCLIAGEGQWPEEDTPADLRPVVGPPAAPEAATEVAAVAAPAPDHVSGETNRRLGVQNDLIANVTRRAPDGDVARLVAATLHVMPQAFDQSACTVYDVDDGVATAIAAIPRSSFTDSWRLDEYPAAAAAVAECSVVAIDRADGRLLTPAVSARLLAERGLASVVLAPLVYGQDVVGLLEAGCGAPGHAADLAAAVGVLADLLAHLLAGTNAIAGLQRRTRDLAQVVEVGLDATARKTADEILHTVVEQLAELTRAPVIDVYAVENDTLRALVSYDGGRFDLEWEDVVIPLVRYPCSRRAVEGGEIVTVDGLDDPCLDEEARCSLEKGGYQALVFVPLVSARRVIWLFELSNYVPRGLDPDLQLVRGLCGVAARALENTALLEQAERRNIILNELVELGDPGGRQADIEGLQRHVAQRL